MLGIEPPVAVPRVEWIEQPTVSDCRQYRLRILKTDGGRCRPRVFRLKGGHEVADVERRASQSAPATVLTEGPTDVEVGRDQRCRPAGSDGTVP